MLADAEERLQKLEDIYDQSVAEKNKLELNIDRTQARLKRSDLLVVALSDEQHRWEKNIKVFYCIICVDALIKYTYSIFNQWRMCFFFIIFYSFQFTFFFF